MKFCEVVMLHPAPRNCPVCHGEMIVTRLYCPNCDVTIDGRFSFGGLGNLTEEQLQFVETFVRCEGKINRVQKVYDIAYPTVRRRLEEVIVAMGYEVGGAEDEEEIDEDTRRKILDDLAAGQITSEDAIKLLQK